MNDQSDAARVIGVWKLVSCTRDIVESGERIDQYGRQPVGYLHYSAEGRMVVFMLNDERPTPMDILASDVEAVALFRSMGAYMGTFAVDGDRVTHHIDGSWNQSWTGTKQQRYFHLEGDTLVLTTDEYRSTYDGRLSKYTLTWERV